jgi:hypothetical protein
LPIADFAVSQAFSEKPRQRYLKAQDAAALLKERLALNRESAGADKAMPFFM